MTLQEEKGKTPVSSSWGRTHFQQEEAPARENVNRGGKEEKMKQVIMRR